jgi:hypothetical protein
MHARCARTKVTPSSGSAREQLLLARAETRDAVVKIPIRVEPADETAPTVEYRWDPDTEILSAQVSSKGASKGMSGSVEVEGADGSWLIFDIAAGRINGVEVAVWPDVQKRNSLAPPAKVEDASIRVPSRGSQPGIASVEVETAVSAEADAAERVFHFRIGKSKGVRTVRYARDLLLELDGSSHLSGLWFLNVPPFPATPAAIA